MQIFHNPLKTKDIRGAWAALGNFDGVHLGHQRVMAVARERANANGVPAGVVTFHPHPLAVVDPRRVPVPLCTLEQRLELLEHAGNDFAVVYTFDWDFAAQPPEVFVKERLGSDLGLGGVVTGRDFLFGRGRAGDVDTLARMARETGMQALIADDVVIDGQRVSSSRIRHILREGRVVAAARLLGRPFFIDGTVVPGDGRGKTLGFPTINLDVHPGLFLRDGVYAGAARVEGRLFAAACHLGPIPTFDKETRSLEIHILGLDHEVYGSEVRIWVLRRLRGVERFSSVDHLIAAMRRDVEQCRLVFESQPANTFVP